MNDQCYRNSHKGNKQGDCPIKTIFISICSLCISKVKTENKIIGCEERYSFKNTKEEGLINCQLQDSRRQPTGIPTLDGFMSEIIRCIKILSSKKQKKISDPLLKKDVTDNTNIFWGSSFVLFELEVKSFFPSV